MKLNGWLLGIGFCVCCVFGVGGCSFNREGLEGIFCVKHCDCNRATTFYQQGSLKRLSTNSTVMASYGQCAFIIHYSRLLIEVVVDCNFWCRNSFIVAIHPQFFHGQCVVSVTEGNNCFVVGDQDNILHVSGCLGRQFDVISQIYVIWHLIVIF